ncbi:hypothetical protein GOP47_0001854 [Adiantum capillus-veneris]|uniref:glycine--tRNA ligase n=1 Tax=Adiantum capillus-veneris TaxID=13818 RepID=A0A9D4V918_ADICA|nr:hypothetical protein GOP47_0001854 [Adiantum capillus-veneris]
MAASHSLACHGSKASHFKAIGWCLQAGILRNARHQQLPQGAITLTNKNLSSCFLFPTFLRCRNFAFASFMPPSSAGPESCSPQRAHGLRCSSTSPTSLVDTESRHVNTDTLPSAPTFQSAIQRLQEYWASVGCAIMQPSNTEVGAGTMNPATFLRVLGPEPWNVAYVEPSIRPDDSRYGDNPNRLQRHTQFQVILKPDPGNSQELYLGSLAALGIDIRAHDVRFVEDNWESPVLGAWGLGWEVWMDGMEITQFTYFQQAGSMPLSPISVEITYGLERILMAVQGVNHFRKIQYAPGITYGEMFLENEKEMSKYYLDTATVDRVQLEFELYEAEAKALLEKCLAIPAYDYVLKASHAFNILDARGAVGVTERARFFGRMRRLARECAQLWVKTRETLDHPLGVWTENPCSEPSHPTSQAAEKVLLARTFVLEIGSEELPSQDVSSSIKQLEEAIQACLKAQRLKHGSISIFGTPRRIVVTVEELASMQDEMEKEIRGPPCKAAFDSKGEPTKALDGFCRKNGISREALYTRVEGKAEFVFATLKEQCRHTIEVLSESLPILIKEISFPKTMRWNSQISYSRPIRWILALYGDAVVPFSFADVQSGQITHTLRSSLSPIVEVSKAEEYLNCIKEAGITICMKERKENIWTRSAALAKTLGGRLPDAAMTGLLDEVANLVEAPCPLLGSFDASFLALPAEVLTTVMRKHQRYFPVEDPEKGLLLPAFVMVANGNIDPIVVRKGNEAVLRARYEDAKFFYQSDVSKALVDFRPQLKGILFQEKLGTMLDKSIRVERMITELGELLGLDSESMEVARCAAPLAYADLVTTVVMEFTSLAGIMGKHYALREGQPTAVANAIFESVLPRNAGDILPTSDPGILLAVADRLDSLVGLFKVGCQPSASADPFGLRRSAYGLVQALVENKKSLNLQKAMEVAASVQPPSLTVSDNDEVLTFVTRRLEQLLIDEGANVEIVRSIISERGNDPWLASVSVKQLEELSKADLLKKVVIAYSRPTRIARPDVVDLSWKVDTQLFQEAEEHALWIAYNKAALQVNPGVGVDLFIEASAELVEPLDNYFNKVFVLAEDKTLQKNRLALLQKVAELPRGIVNFSFLPGF